ncbi:Protein CBG13535 [Caenorhabditis briggsae]|uniref:Protein CBG13535 n=1 Tax=Caenorhabditis briggsae TaxID=6238 RepID=A8XI45_CAEBR|nr:Protein CBG13535 [Caenorhabditis briggsae]CAP32319.2 Protein CBG13535 [Caenorhabditis briggsae]
MITKVFSLLFCLFLIQSVKCQCHRQGDNYIGDLCYSIQNQKLNNQDATNYCRGRSMNLAVLHTTLQANFLASQVRAQSGSNEATFWIGLSHASVSSRFVWDDGTSMSWSNFDGNFPKDNLYVAESVINGKWRTLSGDNVLIFVCSYDPRNGTPGTDQRSTTASFDSTTTGWFETTTKGSTATSMETTEGSSSTFFTTTWSIPTSSIPMSTLTSSPASSSSGSYTKSSPASSSWGTSTMYPTNW